MPGTVATISRRRVLAGGAALALLGVAASACGTPEPPPPAIDDLVAQLDLARHDADLAAAAAAAPTAVPALAVIAAERTRHAQALAAEIARVTGETTTAPPTSVTGQSVPPASVSDVVTALQRAADSAGRLAAVSSGYRAGLLGSIAAACTAAGTIALANGEPPP